VLDLLSGLLVAFLQILDGASLLVSRRVGQAFGQGGDAFMGTVEFVLEFHKALLNGLFQPEELVSPFGFEAFQALIPTSGKGVRGMFVRPPGIRFGWRRFQAFAPDFLVVRIIAGKEMDPAGIHHQSLGGDPVDKVPIVADEAEGAGVFVEGRFQHFPGRYIQVIGGFVEEQ